MYMRACVGVCVCACVYARMYVKSLNFNHPSQVELITKAN